MRRNERVGTRSVLHLHNSDSREYLAAKAQLLGGGIKGRHAYDELELSDAVHENVGNTTIQAFVNRLPLV